MPTFVMPRDTIGAKTTQLADIGKKFIQAGMNYEDIFKSIIGES